MSYTEGKCQQKYRTKQQNGNRGKQKIIQAKIYDLGITTTMYRVNEKQNLRYEQKICKRLTQLDGNIHEKRHYNLKNLVFRGNAKGKQFFFYHTFLNFRPKFANTPQLQTDSLPWRRDEWNDLCRTALVELHKHMRKKPTEGYTGRRKHW